MPMTLFFWSFKILLFPWKKNLHILVIDWSFNNKLTVNTSKTKEIVFRRSRFPNKLLPPLFPDIQRVDSINRVHSKLKGQNSWTFQGLLKDLKLQFSSTKSVDEKTYHTRATSKFRGKYIL